jgi:predicted nucleotidyltransferase
MVPEEKIREFVEKARAGAGENLESMILYGSAAGGDYHAEFSDVNLLCVLRDCSYASMLALAPAARWWEKQKQPPPLFVTRAELRRSTDVFTIELIDMKQHHRVIFGDDVITGLEISMELHRVQVEYELREKLILLRQHLVLAGDDDSRIREVLVRSVSSFATLFRHSLIALGEAAPLLKHEAIAALAQRLGFDASPMEQLLAVRERRVAAKSLPARAIAARYLQVVEKVTESVDTMLDSGKSGSR